MQEPRKGCLGADHPSTTKPIGTNKHNNDQEAAKPAVAMPTLTAYLENHTSHTSVVEGSGAEPMVHHDHAGVTHYCIVMWRLGQDFYVCPMISLRHCRPWNAALLYLHMQYPCTEERPSDCVSSRRRGVIVQC